MNSAGNFGYCRKVVKNDIMLEFSSWGNYALKRKARYRMATSSITANFTCNDSKAANAFVRMLVQPVKVIKRDPNACHAAEFKSAAEMRAFCLKMARVARKRTAERARTTKRRVSK